MDLLYDNVAYCFTCKGGFDSPDMRQPFVDLQELVQSQECKVEIGRSLENGEVTIICMSVNINNPVTSLTKIHLKNDLRVWSNMTLYVPDVIHLFIKSEETFYQHPN